MYQGTNRTALSSQQQIADALVSLMKEKNFSDITVCELCKVSGTSRQTYYSLFNSKENIILFLLQKHCECGQEKECCEDFDSVCRYFSHFFYSNHDLFQLLVENDLTYLLYNTIYEEAMESGCQHDENLSSACKNYAAHFLAGGLTGIVKAYILHDPDADEAHLYEVISSLFGNTEFVKA